MTNSKIAGWLRKFSESGNRQSSANLLAQPAEHLGIGPAKPVDRLLVVADEEQLAREIIVVAKRLDQFDLEPIGVLELVDQQQPQVRGQPPAKFRTRGLSRFSRRENRTVPLFPHCLLKSLLAPDQQPPGLDQQVVEVQRPNCHFRCLYCSATAAASSMTHRARSAQGRAAAASNSICGMSRSTRSRSCLAAAWNRS